MTCQACGQKLPHEARYCSGCGAALPPRPQSAASRHGGGFSFVVIGLLLLSFVVSVFIYPVILVLVGLPGLLVLVNVRSSRQAITRSRLWRRLPWLQRQRWTIAGSALVLWALSTSAVGYAMYTGVSRENAAIAHEHRTATAVAVKATRVEMANVNATAAAKVIARRTNVAVQKTRIVAQKTAAPQETRVARRRAYLAAIRLQRAHTQQTQVAIQAAHSQATTAAEVAAKANADASSTAAASILLDHQGNGAWTSDTFTAPADWWIDYSYDCSSFGSSGNFIVDVKGGNNGFSTSGVNQLKEQGSGETAVHDASGPGVYLQVNSECDWHVIAHQ